MPSFQDSAVIFVIALLLFGPRKLPELARQLGKLMGEFRRASNDFRMQMEDELRIAEQAERQKKIEAIEAASPAPVVEARAENYPVDDKMDQTGYMQEHVVEDVAAPGIPDGPVEIETESVAIATAGELTMRAPETGVPVGYGAAEETAALGSLLDSIPEAKAGNVVVDAGSEGHVGADQHGG
jgi:sec-independent protein translocase protein TatB